jgi:site-specific DNA recombinase
VAAPCEEWIAVPVPALVDEAVFEATQAQLAENRKRKRDRQLGPRWLLQGLTVCRRCGYAYYGKTAPRSRHDRAPGELRYYRCIGADGCRFGGTVVCDNHAVRADRLEAAVWEQVRGLLSEPERVATEYRRRLCQAREGRVPDELVRLDHQIAGLQRGIGRLIDSYAEGVIDKPEFEPRVSGLKARLGRLQAQRQAAAEAAQAERDLSLVIGRLEDFAARVGDGLDRLDWLGRREIIRTLVRRVEVDYDSTEVVFRVPPPDGPHRGGPEQDHPPSWKHCTDGGGTILRLDQPKPAAVEGPGGDARLRRSLPLRRFRDASRPPIGPSLMSAVGLLITVR